MRAVDAEDVELNVILCNDLIVKVVIMDTEFDDVPANSVVNFDITLDLDGSIPVTTTNWISMNLR